MSDVRPLPRSTRRLPFGLAFLVLLGALSTLASGELLTRVTVDGERLRTERALAELEQAGLGPSATLTPATRPREVQRALQAIRDFSALSSSEEAALALAGEKIGLQAGGDAAFAARIEELRGEPSEWEALLEGARSRLGELEGAFDTLSCEDWSGPLRSRDPLEVDDEHLYPLYELRVQLCGLAAAEALAGRRDEAWRMGLLVAEITRRQRDAGLLAASVRQAATDLCARTLPCLLAAVGPPPSELRQALEPALAELALPADVGAALRWDMTCALSAFRAWEERGETIFVYPPPARHRLPFLQRIEFSQVRTHYVELNGELLRALRRSPRDALARLAEVRAQPVRLAEVPPRMLADPVSDLLRESLETRARINLVRVALALCGSESTCGYGAALPAETPDPLLGDPTSPFGAPVRWARDTPRSGTLWCVGADGRDEQGRGDDISLKLDLNRQ